jgi:hypothetical protein
MSRADDSRGNVELLLDNVLLPSQNPSIMLCLAVGTFLDNLVAQIRDSSSQTNDFRQRKLCYKKDLANKVVDLALKDPTLTYLSTASAGADQYNIDIADKCIRGALHILVYGRVRATILRRINVCPRSHGRSYFDDVITVDDFVQVDVNEKRGSSRKNCGRKRKNNTDITNEKSSCKSARGAKSQNK